MPPTVVEQNEKLAVDAQVEPTFDELLAVDSDKMASPTPEMLFTDQSRGLD